MEYKPKTLNQKKFNYFFTNTNGKDTINGKKLLFSNVSEKVSLKTLLSLKKQARATSLKFIKLGKSQQADCMLLKKS